MGSNAASPELQSNGIPAGLESVEQAARALLAEGQAERSEELFRQLIGSPTHSVVGLYGAAVARLAQDDLETASTLLAQVLERDPQHANAVFQLGAIAERRGEIATARTYYERALTLMPGHAGAERRLAATAQPHVQAPVGTAERRRSASAVYDLLSRDDTPLSKQTVTAMDALETKVHPAFTAYAGRRVAGFVLLVALAIAAALGLKAAVQLIPPTVTLPFDPTPVLDGLLKAVLIVAGAAVAFGYARTRSTTVTLEQGRLQIRRGILSRRLTNVELWRVRGIELERSLVNRLTGDGTIVLELSHLMGETHPRRQLGRGRQLGRDDRVELCGLARGERLEEIYQELLNLVFLLRSNPAVKGIIQ